MVEHNKIVKVHNHSIDRASHSPTVSNSILLYCISKTT